MAGLAVAVGALALSTIREQPAEARASESEQGWTLGEALRTPQFYIVGCGIAATYFVSSTINAFTMSYLHLHGVGLGIAVITFSIQSAGHAAFPLMMGGIAARIGVRALLVFGLVIQAIGMTVLAFGWSVPALIVFAIGVGGGYGTLMIGTTLAIEKFYGRAPFRPHFRLQPAFLGHLRHRARAGRLGRRPDGPLRHLVPRLRRAAVGSLCRCADIAAARQVGTGPCRTRRCDGAGPLGLKVLSAVSAIFLFAGATTFNSLGVALFAMQPEFHWSDAQTGGGFLALGLSCCCLSMLPVALLPRIGGRWTCVAGCLALAAGFLVAAATSSLAMIYAAVAILGLGYSLVANTSGIFLLAGWFGTRAHRG